jgi:prephenate dehydrogenase
MVEFKSIFGSRGKIAIIGVGLIGGSLGLALKERGLIDEVVGVGRSEESLREALKRGAVDWVTTSYSEGVRGADIVVLATPVKTILEICPKISSNLKSGCIVTDVGSTKWDVVQTLSKIMPKGVHFLGGHPITGSEKRGVKAARGDLFINTHCFLTPLDEHEVEAHRVIKLMWEAVGSKVLFIHPAKHDLVMAATSHLPHLIAAALIDLIMDYAKREKSVLQALGGSFRDMTRIASSDPVLWRDVFLTNKEMISQALGKFKEILICWEALIRKEDAVGIFEKFKESKEWRGKIFGDVKTQD